MEKIVIFILLVSTVLSAEITDRALQKNCIACHIEQKIPSSLIYRRYLLRYSTHKAIKKSFFTYLNNPIQENSIMPKQFFLKFPQKEKSDLNETILKESIDAYLDYFDIKKELILP
jgi:hypothetical protein